MSLPEGKEYLCNHIPLNVPGANLDFIKDQVEIAYGKGADIIIASVHYGNAYQLFPGEHIVKMTHRLFNECGIDIILGGHAHNIQPMEYYDFISPITKKKKQGFVIYCMGDFVAYDIYTWGHLPVWLKIIIAKTAEETFIKEIKVNPVYTLGIYRNKHRRELKFFNAMKLWDRIEHGEEKTLPLFNRNEALYLKGIYKEVFPNITI